jgi:hypothetical protein
MLLYPQYENDKYFDIFFVRINPFEKCLINSSINPIYFFSGRKLTLCNTDDLVLRLC